VLDHLVDPRAVKVTEVALLHEYKELAIFSAWEHRRMLKADVNSTRFAAHSPRYLMRWTSWLLPPSRFLCLRFGDLRADLSSLRTKEFLILPKTGPSACLGAHDLRSPFVPLEKIRAANRHADRKARRR